MPSSSSSDSEEDARLKAAAVTISDIFAEKKAKSTLRAENPVHDHARDNRYDLDPECKKFLATKLDEILEKTYKFATKKTERAEESSASSGESGIRLFSNSELLADVPEPGDEPGRTKKRRRKDILPRQSATDEMLKSCAVSADWLLNQNPLRKN